MICGNCGRDNWDWVRTCSHCGTKLPATPVGPRTAGRKKVEAALGRGVSDNEWESLERIASRRARRAARRRQLLLAPVRFVGELAGAVVVFVLTGLLVGVVLYPLFLGLVWAYSPGTLNREGYGGLFGAALFTGFVMVGMTSDEDTSPLVWLGLACAVVALVIGAILRVAGG